MDAGTVTSVWWGQLRTKSRTRPRVIAPGSALTNSFGTSLCASHAHTIRVRFSAGVR
jgi:hypothetical protein